MVRYVTYSIVARDRSSGELGVAVQSHFFSVGSLCPWVEPGVGAVATQSEVLVSYGPLGLDQMRAGTPPTEALEALIADDNGAAMRQVAMVSAAGDVAVHTGDRCIAEAGHVTGDGWSAQANMMRDTGVPEAMGEAFEAAAGDLATRMLAALDAAEAAGGDIRGRQSACLLVAPAEGPSWARGINVRVEDHADPLGELRRLVELQRAYISGEPVNAELAFWVGLARAGEGAIAEGRALMAPALGEHDGWAQLLERLPACGLAEQHVVDAVLKRS